MTRLSFRLVMIALMLATHFTLASASSNRLSIPDDEHRAVVERNQPDEIKSVINYSNVGDYVFEPQIVGDVNNDGHVELLDIMLLIDYILNKEAEGLILDYADVNNDSTISIADVTAVVNIVLGINEDAPPVYSPQK